MRRRPVRDALAVAGLLILAFIVAFPLLFALSISLQGDTVSPRLVPEGAPLDPGVFFRVFSEEPELARWILNSFVVSTCVTLAQLVTSALAGYALAQFRFRGRSLLFFVFLGSLMIPWESTILPNYLLVSEWHAKNSYLGLVLPFAASGFGIFLMRQAYKAVPLELYEAAVIDGCGPLRYLVQMLTPLTTPALMTLAIYTFINTWNQFYWPLLVTDSPEWFTTQTGISVFQSVEIASYNLSMAATLIVLAPTLVLLVVGQRALVSGLMQGALKG